jgi:hypothetical protein
MRASICTQPNNLPSIYSVLLRHDISKLGSVDALLATKSLPALAAELKARHGEAPAFEMTRRKLLPSDVQV